MKKQLVKRLLCLGLSLAVVLGDASLTFAAENPSQAVVETEQEDAASAFAAEDSVQDAELTVAGEDSTQIAEEEEPEVTESVETDDAVLVSLKGASYTPSVSYLYASAYSYSGYIYISYSGYGYKFNIYVNDKLVTTQWNDNYYEEDDDDVYAYCSDSYDFYECRPGATYKIKVVPVTKDGTEQTAAASTYTVTTDMTKVTEINSWLSSSDVKSNTSGYVKPQVYVYWYASSYNSGISYEVYRSNKSSSGYKKIDTTTSTYYYDETVGAGKTYYYKVRPVSSATEYSSAVNGAYSSATKVEVQLEGYLNISLDAKNRPVIYCSNTSSFASGFYIYRSTKKNKGYKKIATTAESTYVDKSAKTGKTYYYKVTPYYYDTSSKKYYAGETTDPQGVKVVLGYLTLDVKVTGTTKAKLSWNKVTGAQAYDVYCKSSLTGDAYKLETTTKKLTYTKKKLTNGEGYSFLVQAYKKNSKGVKTYYVSSSSYETIGIQAPSVTIAKRTYSYAAGSATETIKNKLTWDRVYGASGYYVERYNSSKGDWDKIKTLKAKVTSYTYTQKVTASNTSSTRIRIVAYKGKDRYESTSVSLYAAIGLPSSVKVKKSSGDTETTVSWKSVAGATSYSVYRRTPLGSRVYVGTTDKTTIVDSGLTPGITYTYYVTAYNSKLDLSSETDTYYSYTYDDDSVSGTALPSNYTTYKLPVKGSKISGAKNAKTKKVTVTWNKSSMATKYVIYRSTNKKKGYKKIATVSASKTSYTDSKLKKSKTYYYKVAAYTVNDAGIGVQSSQSAAKSVKITK